MDTYFSKLLQDFVDETMKHAGIKPDPDVLVAALNPTDLKGLLGRWKKTVTEEVTPKMSKWFKEQWGIAAALTPKEVNVFLGPNVRDIRAAQYVTAVENRLVGIGDTMYEQATHALRTSLETGEGMPKAAARVADSLQVSANRAMTIARTESAAAVNGADNSIAVELHDQGIVTRKVWLATSDDRTRPDHDDADGQAADADGTFTVGGATLAYPGDPDGDADQVINCRCTTLLELADD